jgi:hypothetical protein
MLVAKVPILVKITWLGSLTIPFFSFLLAPLVPIYLRAIVAESETVSESVEILFGLIGYTCLMTLCGAVAVGQHLTSRKSEWYKMVRSEV